MPEAIAATESTADVAVSIVDGHLIFEPAEQRSVGLIFYPGGRVEPEAYAPYARQLAQDGYTVAIVSMPLNLALFGIDRAGAIIERFPQIERWAVGGHSLGGVAAARFVAKNPEADGLILLASYADQSLHERAGLYVLTIYGTNDGLIAPSLIENEKGNLPLGTRSVVIEGGNHSQFGWYGLQNGDNEATVSRAEQAAQTAAATRKLLECISN